MHFNRISVVLPQHSIVACSFVIALSVAGCTVVSSPATCSKDTNVTGCIGSSTGYSCSGSDTPTDSNSSLKCGTGSVGAAGATDYCCIDTATTTCNSDLSVACAAGQLGYSCTSSAPPQQTDTSLTCGAGVTGNGGTTAYCCTSTSAAVCNADATVVCPTGQVGYSCAASYTPQQINTSLTCGTGVAGIGGTIAYCCVSATTTSCATDATVSCPTGQVGYNCPAAYTPQQSNASLTCGAGAAGTAGNVYYCCASAAACVQDTTVDCSTVVSAGKVGFTCSSGEPNNTDPALACVRPPSGSSSQFCCSPNGVCSLDSTATSQCSGATPNGYVCTGSAVPSGLTCAAGVSGSEGTTVYCCS